MIRKNINQKVRSKPSVEVHKRKPTKEQIRKFARELAIQNQLRANGYCNASD
jgi:hypothetical protein